MIPVKPENVRFTDSQWQAIYQSGDNILVSASAGSGKTTVLTQRIIEKLKNGSCIDQLLVVTYTEAAAREMQERIKHAIQKAVNQAVDAAQRQHLQQQLLRMPQASISTIHAFCLQVIRRYFYMIPMDPRFRLMTDETEIELLKEEIWASVKERLYQEAFQTKEGLTADALAQLVGRDEVCETPFFQLARAYASDKSDEPVTDLVLSLYGFSRAHPNPEQWLAQLPEWYHVTEQLRDSPLFEQLLLEPIQLVCDACVVGLQQAIATAEQEPFLEKMVGCLQTDLAQISHFVSLLNAKAPYDALYDAAHGVTFERWPNSKKVREDETLSNIAAYLKQQRDIVKQQFVAQLRDTFFTMTESQHIEILQQTRAHVQTLADCTMQFATAYAQHKQTHNVLEFNDLEHLTLQILAPYNAQSATRQLSDAAVYYRQKFEEVLVDEYQDVNRLQEQLIGCLAQEHNRFMVGDVKQSIYAFRLADPSLFLNKYLAYGQSEGGTRIILSENFRSRGEVVTFTNFIFQQIMDPAVGQMAYDEAALLVQGNRSYPKSTHHHTEVLLYESDSEEELIGDVSESFVPDDRTRGEVALVAARIQELLSQPLMISDGEGGQRPVQYRDIVLLTPTKKNNVVVQEVCQQYGVPVLVNDTETYFQRTEIMIMMAILSAIDNPQQDIPIAAILRSPIVGLRENDLALIRIHAPSANCSYFDAVTHFVALYEQEHLPHDAGHRQVYEALHRFTVQLSRWRQVAVHQRLTDLIWQIYEDTLFLEYVGGLPSGAQRVANLHALYERAETYEQSQFKGLFQFVRFIEKMQERTRDLSEAPSELVDDNVVRMMTIHASKGLEFPVVFVLDTNKRFNKRDVRQGYVFSEEFGVGTKSYHAQNRSETTTLLHTGVAQHKNKKLLAEEMRKLYVALTRAKEKLIIVGSITQAQKSWEQWGQVQSEKQVVLPAFHRLRAQSFLDWLGSALVRHPQISNPNTSQPLAVLPASLDIPQVQLSIHSTVAPASFDGRTKHKLAISDWLTEQTNPAHRTTQWDDHLQKMDAPYRFAAATRTTGYQSVSELKRLFEDPSTREINERDTKGHRFTDDLTQQTPTFLQRDTQQVTAAEIGTAMHLVMQKIDVTLPITQLHIETTIEQLVSARFINSAVAQHINRQQISDFFSSPLGQQMIAAHHHRREVPFSLMMPAANLFHELAHDSDSSVLVHGIIDGYFETEKGLVVYDFKTDRLSQHADVERTMLSRYNGQMQTYCLALAQITQQPIAACYLCALSCRQNILVPIERDM